MRPVPFMAVAFWIASYSALAAADPAGETAPADGPADKTFVDMHAIQGHWTREYTNRQGATFRADKTIDGNRDSVTELDAHGNTIYSHRCKFSLKLDGKVRVLTFSDVTVTAGPNRGARVPGPKSFIYKLDGDTMFEVWGLLEGDAGPPSVYIWTRTKKDP